MTVIGGGGVWRIVTGVRGGRGAVVGLEYRFRLKLDLNLDLN